MPSGPSLPCWRARAAAKTAFLYSPGQPRRQQSENTLPFAGTSSCRSVPSGICRGAEAWKAPHCQCKCHQVSACIIRHLMASESWLLGAGLLLPAAPWAVVQHSSHGGHSPWPHPSALGPGSFPLPQFPHATAEFFTHAVKRFVISHR